MRGDESDFERRMDDLKLLYRAYVTDALSGGRIAENKWKDSLDDSDGEMGDDGVRKSKRKRIVVSPLKRNRGFEGARRPKVPWSTAETLAVLKGYEKYGANWKRIKDENPIQVRRTNGDIKDKF